METIEGVFGSVLKIYNDEDESSRYLNLKRVDMFDTRIKVLANKESVFSFVFSIIGRDKKYYAYTPDVSMLQKVVGAYTNANR